MVLVLVGKLKQKFNQKDDCVRREYDGKSGVSKGRIRENSMRVLGIKKSEFQVINIYRVLVGIVEVGEKYTYIFVFRCFGFSQ